MKNYNKIILGVLLIPTLATIIGCNSNSHPKNMFSDESKIIKESDNFSYGERLGETTDKESNIKFTSFSGTDTIFELTADEKSKADFTFESKVNKGDFKVVLISPENKVINIVEGTMKNNKAVQIDKGISRMKFVGKKADGQIDIKIEANDKVNIEALEEFKVFD